MWWGVSLGPPCYFNRCDALNETTRLDSPKFVFALVLSTRRLLVGAAFFFFFFFFFVGGGCDVQALWVAQHYSNCFFPNH